MAENQIHPDREIVTRKEAIARGLNRYFTGKACPRGHLSERMVCDWKCVQCRIEFRREKYKDPEYRAQKRSYYNTRYAENDAVKEFRKAAAKDRYLANPQKAKKYHKEYYAKNRIDFLEKSKEYREKRLSCPVNLEKERARNRKRKKDNPEYVRIGNRNRRARVNSASGSHTVDDVKSILSRQFSKCTYCSVDISEKYHVDHMNPLSRGGSNGPENLQCLCGPCNLKKWTKTHEEYLDHIKKKPSA